MGVAEVSIVISFIGFLVLFAKKVYPLVVGGVDSYIAEVRSKIDEAERLKSEAEKALEEAERQKLKVASEIKMYQKKSRERIKELEQENEKYLKVLEMQSEASFDKFIQSEFARHKKELMGQLSDLVIQKLMERIEAEGLNGSLNVSSDDLKMLR
ncbi:MAG: hypothetical protein E7015_03715 [Alphaproteobacteria bacterium]|nr:hypothetical protein [Alphaproteobacteria bacterium]